MDERASRYAIPLATLVAGAQVARAEQVEVQAEVPAPPSSGVVVLPAWGEGGGGGGNGE